MSRLLLVILFLLPFTTNSAQIGYSSPVISVEAEHAEEISGWRMVGGLSGKALQDESEKGMGWLLYNLEFPQAGNYYVHLLCLAPGKNTSMNDCYVFLGDQQLNAIGDSSLRPDGIRVHSGEFSWSGLPKGPGAHTPDAIRKNNVYFRVEKPGVYPLRIVSRSKGFTLDKILLHYENTEEPEGTGPEESGLSYQPIERIGCWDVFEIALQSERTYANPFRDMQVKGEFFNPSGKLIRVCGFYDGEQSWKVRFMPDQAGIWEYRTRSSDTSMIVQGRFECLPSDIPGLISVYRENPIWFGYMNSSAVLIRSLHCGDRFFANQDNHKTGEKWSVHLREEYLDWVQGQGYNMLSIASHYLNRQEEQRGLGWNTPVLWDEELQQPDPMEFSRMEEVLDDLHVRQIIIYPFAGFFGRGSGFPKDEAEQDLYLEYTIARLGSYWNILYMIGGPEPLLRKRPYLPEEEIDILAMKIKELDVYGHLLSIHNRTGDDHFIEYIWHDYGILQGPKTTDRESLSRIMLENHHPERPLYMQETLWPGNKHHPDYTLEDVRKNALVMLLSGGAINFGDMKGNSSSGFSGKIEFNQKVQERHDIIHGVWNFFESLPWYQMKPRQDLVNRGYCLAKEGQYYLVYSEDAESLEIKIIPGKYSGSWIDAKTFKEEIPIPEINGSTKLIPPESRKEWLLYIQATGNN